METSRYRQVFHLEPPNGWLNDPNGLSFFKDNYHVYFQHSPMDPKGGTLRCWGHYYGKNLLDMTYDKDVLVPDIPEDRSGVFSGSAVVCGDELHIFYTGNVEEEGDYDYVTAGRGANVIHVTTKDGSVMSEKKVVLTNDNYPKFCSCHVRDPKVWYEDNKWYMILGARTLDDKGVVLFYTSENLDKWTFERCDSVADFGYMWECPDIVFVEGHRFLGISPQGLDHYEFSNQNIFQSGYFKYDEIIEDFTEWDMGFDFYAPQTFVSLDGRRILFGWMGVGDDAYTNATIELGWQHCLTLPRELTLGRDGFICQNPIRELEAYRDEEITLTFETGHLAHQLSLPFDLVAKVEGTFEISFDEKMKLHWDGKVCTLEFLDEKFGAGRTVRKALLDSCEDVRIVADMSSVEIFLDGGRVVMGSRMYPEKDSVSVTCVGLEATIYKLCK